MNKYLIEQFGLEMEKQGIDAGQLNRQELGDQIFEKLKEVYDAKEKTIGADAMRYHERMIMLSVLDTLWKDHLLNMDHLKEGIGLRGYGQHDPLVEYKRESFDMFEEMMQKSQQDAVRYLFHMQIMDAPTAQPVAVAESDGDQLQQQLRHPENALQHRWTIWKRSSNVARKKSWSRHAWRDRMATLRRSKLCAGRPKSEETILVRAGQARNTRSATAQEQRRKNEPLAISLCNVEYESGVAPQRTPRTSFVTNLPSKSKIAISRLRAATATQRPIAIC